LTSYQFTLAGVLAMVLPGSLISGPRPRIENLNKLPLAF